MDNQSHHFNGPAYTPDLDQERLNNQFDRILSLMLDSQWRTLPEIEAITRDPQASISAQLRHARKKRFGGFRVEKRRRGRLKHGLYEYRVLDPLLTETHSGQLEMMI